MEDPPAVRRSVIQCVVENDIDQLKLHLAENPMLSMADMNGWTALHHAAYRSNCEILELLLKHAKNDAKELLDRVTWEKETPLLLACRSEKVDKRVIHLLLSNGADPSAENSEEHTAFHYLCCRAGNLPYIKLLRDMGGVLDYELSVFYDLMHCLNLVKDEEALRYFSKLIPKMKVRNDRPNNDICYTAMETVEWNKELAFELLRKVNLEFINSQILFWAMEDREDVKFDIVLECVRMGAEYEGLIFYYSSKLFEDISIFKEFVECLDASRLNFWLFMETLMAASEDTKKPAMEIVLKQFHDKQVPVESLEPVKYLEKVCIPCVEDPVDLNHIIPSNVFEHFYNLNEQFRDFMEVYMSTFVQNISRYVPINTALDNDRLSLHNRSRMAFRKFLNAQHGSCWAGYQALLDMLPEVPWNLRDFLLFEDKDNVIPKSWKVYYRLVNGEWV